MIVSMTVSHFMKICQVLTILHKLICRGVANFGTRCRNRTQKVSEYNEFHLGLTVCEGKELQIAGLKLISIDTIRL